MRPLNTSVIINLTLLSEAELIGAHLRRQAGSSLLFCPWYLHFHLRVRFHCWTSVPLPCLCCCFGYFGCCCPLLLLLSLRTKSRLQVLRGDWF